MRLFIKVLSGRTRGRIPAPTVIGRPTESTNLDPWCLTLGFTAVNRQHDQDNSYKGHLIGAGLQVQCFRPLTTWQEAWQHPGRHSAGEGAESSASCSEGS